MRKYLVLLFLSFTVSYAQETYVEYFKSGWFFNFNMQNAGSYFDNGGNDTPSSYSSVVMDTDTSQAGVKLDTLGKLTNFTSNNVNFRFAYQYLMEEDWALFGGVSLTHFGLDLAETFQDTARDAQGNYIYDLSGNPLINKAKNGNPPSYGLFRADYINLGSSYMLSSTSVDLVLSGEFRIPVGFDPSVVTDSSYEFLSDGALEFLAGSVAKFKFEKSEIMTGIRYNYRGEEFSDQLIMSAKFSLTTVPNTKLYFLGNFVSPVNPITKEDNFTTAKFPLKEAYLDAGVGFSLLVKDKYLFDIGYTLRPAGKNTWKHNNFRLNLGWFFK